MLGSILGVGFYWHCHRLWDLGYLISSGSGVWGRLKGSIFASGPAFSVRVQHLVFGGVGFKGLGFGLKYEGLIDMAPMQTATCYKP